jgi:hypothetical protein
MSDYWKEVKAQQGEVSSRAVVEVLRPSNEMLIKKSKDGAMWAFIIGGLSVVNVAYGLFGTPIRFSLGLRVADLIYDVGHAIGPVFGYFALAADLAIIGSLCFLGVQARKLKIWAFYSLIAILVLDIGFFVVVMVLAGETDLTSAPKFGSLQTGNALVVGVLVHVFAILALVAGLQALLKYRQRQREGKA